MERFTGAAVVFFAYIGFDAVSTVAEETKNPARDLPIGIIASLIICTILYVLVAAVFTGMVPWETVRSWTAAQRGESLTMALETVAPQALWQNTVIAFGSVVAHTAVLLVFQLGQPRIFFSMARDGLLPSVFASVHPRFKTPHVTTILTGVAVGGIAAFATVDEMVSLTNIGTLFAFILVCVGVMVLRHKDPERHETVQSSVWSVLVAGSWRALVRAVDLLPAGRFLLALCRLADAGTGGLFFVRLHAQCGRAEDGTSKAYAGGSEVRGALLHPRGGWFVRDPARRRTTRAVLGSISMPARKSIIRPCMVY